MRIKPTKDIKTMVRAPKSVFFGIVAAAGLLFAAPQAQAGKTVMTGMKAPQIGAKSIDGKSVSLKSMVAKNKVVIVDFWASWCKPCKVELPFLAEMHQKYGKKGLAVVAVNVSDDDAKIKSYLKGKGIKFPVIRDKSKSIVGAYDPKNMPTSYIIGPNGKVKHMHKGFRNGDKKTMEQQIRSML